MEAEAIEETVADVSGERLDRLVKNHVWASIGVGLVPIPMLDMVALTGVQLNLVRKIAQAYDVPFLQDKVKNILGSLVGGVVAPAMGSPIVASIVKAVPVIGQTVGALTVPAIAGASTYAVGRVFIQHFASGGTFLTFDPEKVKDYYAQMFAEGQEKAKTVADDIKKDEGGKRGKAKK